jgi:hypothetical protein
VNNHPGEPLGPAKRLKNPNARMQKRIEYNRNVHLLNAALRIDFRVGTAVRSGSLPGMVSSRRQSCPDIDDPP